MNMFDAMVYLYPDLEPKKDFQIWDDSDGKGPYIGVWETDTPKPTTEELQRAWEELQAQPVPELPETDAERMARLEAENATLLLELVQTQTRQNQVEKDQAALLLSLVEGGVL
ncbi:XkdW family protein [Paenibacillus riograndensis]|uniref:Bacteriophage SP-beta YorD domain-containing protein n=1 Tax=Paenibacillus riograndensis SBR5 TaxID=1073571 RepID=A0A0E4HE03_9BACL|nr:XkdW family protein [Paenibacillus riograndensis]CQR58437.1 hypothetical protein PRIO_6086 [Paenibacillus riograndensis SBR5]